MLCHRSLGTATLVTLMAVGRSDAPVPAGCIEALDECEAWSWQAVRSDAATPRRAAARRRAAPTPLGAAETAPGRERLGT